MENSEPPAENADQVQKPLDTIQPTVFQQSPSTSIPSPTLSNECSDTANGKYNSLSLNNFWWFPIWGILASFVSVSDYSFTNALSYCLINCLFEIYFILMCFCVLWTAFFFIIILQWICVGRSPVLSLQRNGILIMASGNTQCQWWLDPLIFKCREKTNKQIGFLRLVLYWDI